MFNDIKLKIAQPIFERGKNFDSQKLFNDAIQCYKEAIKTYPKYQEAYNKLGTDYMNTGAYKNALLIYQKLIQFNPQNSEYYNYLAVNYLRLKDYTQASLNFKRAINCNDQDDIYYANLGFTNICVKNYQGAIWSYKQAIKINPQNSEYCNSLGASYSYINNMKLAAIFYGKAINLNNSIPLYYQNLADAYYSLHKYNECVWALNQVLYIKPNDDEAYNSLGFIYARTKNYKKAVSLYIKAINLNNNKDYFYDNLGYAYFNLHEYKKCILAYKHAINLNPNNENYYNAIQIASQKETDINDNKNLYYLNNSKVLNNDHIRKTKNNSSSPNKPVVNYSKELNSLIGLSAVTNQLNKFINTFYVTKLRTGQNKHGEIHLVFEGAPGTGKTTVAKLFSKILYQKGIVPTNNYSYLNATSLTSKWQGVSVAKVKKVLKKAMGGVLFIDEAYSLGIKETGVEQAVDTLITGIENHVNDIVVILAGYTEPMENLLNNVNPGLKSRFPSIIKFPNYSNQDCFKILEFDFQKQHLEISKKKNTKNILKKYFINYITIKKSEDGTKFGNAREVRNICNSLRDNLSNRLANKYGQNLVKLRGSKVLNIITLSDIKATFRINNKKIKHDYVKDLNKLIGLSTIKAQIKTYINRVKVNKILSGNNNHGEIHLVFEGGPGTGKTTVAKLFGKILYQKGIIPTNNYSYLNATSLTSKWQGGSVSKVKRALRKAVGGVLFIDEAYSLGIKETGTEQAVDALITGVENHIKDIVVILAGYTEPMENLLNDVNPGLKSRFPTVIKFPNYSNEECLQIFYLYMNKKHLSFASDTTKTNLKVYMTKYITNQKVNNSKNFANARTVKNVFNIINDAFANRLASLSKNDLITLKDVNKLRVITTNDVITAFSHLS